jgi:hypothetical protein
MTLGNIINLVSAIVVLTALVSGAAVLLVTRKAMVALAVLLDLLSAAGLLALTTDPTYINALFAAGILAIRQVVTWGLTSGHREDTS